MYLLNAKLRKLIRPESFIAIVIILLITVNAFAFTSSQNQQIEKSEQIMPSMSPTNAPPQISSDPNTITTYPPPASSASPDPSTPPPSPLPSPLNSPVVSSPPINSPVPTISPSSSPFQNPPSLPIVRPDTINPSVMPESDLIEIRCVEWYQDRPFFSADYTSTLNELGTIIPHSNYILLKCEVFTQNNEVTLGTSTQLLIHSLSLAKQYGYKIIFRIHMDGSQLFIPNDAGLWFNSFKSVVTSYAVLAESYGVESFCFANEFTYLETPAYADNWGNLIKDLRKIYSGELWYETNWWYLKSGAFNSLDQKLSINWFSEVDSILVSCYWEIANTTNIDANTLINNWNNFRAVKETDIVKKSHLVENVVHDLKILSSKFNKQIIVVSGIASANGACMTPWAYGNYYSNTQISTEEQAIWYEALFQVFHDEDFVRGFICDGAWSTTSYHEITKEFCIQNKPTQNIVEAWFSKISSK